MQIFTREALALGVVLAKFEGAVHQAGQVDLFANDLTHRKCLTVTNEIAPAEFFGRNADDLGDAVKMSVERKDALRGAESTECSVRRGVCGYSAALDSDIWTFVRTRGMDCAARKNDGGKRLVRAAVDREINLHGEESSVACYAGAVN